MKSALLIILLSNSGHWLSDGDCVASVAWTADAPMPACDLIWDLQLAGVRLSGEKIALKEGVNRTEIHLPCPRVRARTTLTWNYRLISRKDGKELESGRLLVHAYPSDLTSGWAVRVGRRKLVVCDVAEGLPKVLSAAKVSFERVGDVTKLRGPQPDVILVGAETIGEEPAFQAPIMALASGGASAMIFRQSKPASLAGFELTRRTAPKRFAWVDDHALLNGLAVDDPSFWADHLRDDLVAIRLPQGAAALEIGWWPTEVKNDSQAVPIDALLATQTVGKGRIVFCQIPLGDWNNDPRSQILLGNALDYLLTPPEPTPPIGKRVAVRTVPRSTTGHSVLISPGD